MITKHKKRFKLSVIEEAGYRCTRITDTHKPVIWLEGNGYKFNTTLIKREALEKKR